MIELRVQQHFNRDTKLYEATLYRGVNPVQKTFHEFMLTKADIRVIKEVYETKILPAQEEGEW